MMTAQPDEHDREIGAPGILIVDDEDIVRRMVTRRMQMDGFRVWEARNGEEAVELFRLFRGEIHGVLLDVCLPGLDGADTLTLIREINPSVVACFLTGHSQGYTEEDLLRRGAVAVFTKGSVNWNAVRDAFRQPIAGSG